MAGTIDPRTGLPYGVASAGPWDPYASELPGAVPYTVGTAYDPVLSANFAPEVAYDAAQLAAMGAAGASGFGYPAGTFAQYATAQGVEQMTPGATAQRAENIQASQALAARQVAAVEQDRFTADQKAKMARGGRLAGEVAASAVPFAAQAAALYAPTTGSKYADEQLAGLRKEKLKGWNLSAGDKAVFDAGRANISANADAQTRANLAQNLMSRGRSAADHIALMRENARAVVGGNVKMVAAEAQARARNAAAKLKEFEGLIAFKDARERQRRNYLAQSLGAMGGIVGQTLEAQGVRDNTIEGLDPKTAKYLAENPEAAEALLALFETTA